MRSKFLTASIVFLTSLAWSALTKAQVKSTGTVLGTVTDSSGAVIPDVNVALKNTGTGITMAATTDAVGTYSFPVVPVGEYSLTVAKTGFKTSVLSGISVSALENVRLDVALTLGAVTEEVTVVATPPAVNTVTADEGNTVSGNQLHNLPLASRMFTQLIFLEPGVVGADPTSPSGGGGFGSNSVANFNLNGVRSDANNLQIDGVRNLDTFGGNAFVTPNLNAIAEFRIENNSYSAATGRVGGGQINLISRSGTNRFHGNVFEYFRNDKLNARNFFALNQVDPSTGQEIPNSARPENRYNDWGYDVGGPIKKDRLFFFWSEEWRRIIQSTGTHLGLTPTPAQRGGTFSGIALTNPAGMITPTGAPCVTVTGSGTSAVSTIDPSCIDHNATILLNDFFPLPNSPGTRNFRASDPDSTRWREESIRLDAKITDKWSFYARYTQDNATLYNPFSLFGGNDFPKVAASEQFFPIYNWAAHVTFTPKPTFISEFRWGLYYGTDKRLEHTDAKRASATGLNIPELFPFNDGGLIPGLSFGAGGYSGIYLPWPFHNLAFTQPIENTNTWVKGHHTFKFGLLLSLEGKSEVASATGNETNGVFNFSGSATGDSMADFLLGRAFQYTEVESNPFGKYRWYNLEPYFEDQIKLRPNLTLTAGLRYSYFRPEHEEVNLMSAFSPSLYDPAKAPQFNPDGTIVPGTEDFLNGLFQAGKNSPYGSAIINSRKNGWAPRLGIVWDPTGSGKMSVRAGYGIFYDRWGSYSQFSSTNPPFNNTVTIFHTFLSNPAGTSTSARPIFPISLRNPITPWVMPSVQKWSVGVQREIRGNTTVSVAYVGTKGSHLNGIVDLNQIRPNLEVAQGTLDPNLIRPFPGYSGITSWTTNRDSTYNSAQLSAIRRMQHGLAFQASYTISKALTNGSDAWTGAQDSHNISAEKGLASFDASQVLTFNYIWEVPFFKNKTGATKAIFDNWSVGGITNFQKGFPATVTLPTDNAGVGGGLERPNLVGNVSGPKTLTEWFNTAAFVTPPIATFGNAGNGIVRQPGINSWVLALYKRIPIHEEISAQFRAQFFNAFNHPSFSSVDTGLGSGSFGEVTSARDPRIIQFGIELSF
jgi:hypothetical protein